MVVRRPGTAAARSEHVVYLGGYSDDAQLGSIFSAIGNAIKKVGGTAIKLATGGGEQVVHIVQDLPKTATEVSQGISNAAGRVGNTAQNVANKAYGVQQSANNTQQQIKLSSALSSIQNNPLALAAGAGLLAYLIFRPRGR